MRDVRAKVRRLVAVATTGGVVLALAPSAGAAGKWLAPQRVANPTTGIGSTQLVTGANGATAITYTATSGGRPRVFAAVRDARSPITAAAPRGFPYATAVSGGGKEELVGPDIAIDAAGNTTVMWSEFTSESGSYTQFDTWVRSRPAGGSWGPGQLVVQGTNYYFEAPDEEWPTLQVARNGRTIVSLRGWTYERAPGATTFVQSGAPGPATVVMNHDGNSAGCNATIAGGQLSVTLQVRPEGGAWSAPIKVATTPTSGQGSCKAQIASDGTVGIVWEVSLDNDQYRPDHRFYGVARRVGTSFAVGNWTTAKVLGVWQPWDYLNDFPAAFDYDLGVYDSSTLYASWYDQRNGHQTAYVPSAPQASGPSYAFASIALSGGTGNDPVIRARVQPPGGVFGPEQTVIAPSGSAVRYRDASSDVDDQGNAYVSWVREISDGTQLVGVSAYDAVAPAIGTVTVPAAATVGTAAALAVAATDRISAITYAWDFGDGTKGTGASVTKAWSSAGTYSVKVTATDEAGNASTATRSVSVTAAGTPKVDVKPWLYATVATGGKTLVRTVELYSVKAGDKVTLACTGTGCDATARRTFTVAAATAKLVTPFGPGNAGISLSPGAVLTVTIARTGSTSQTVKWTTRSGAAPVKG